MDVQPYYRFRRYSRSDRCFLFRLLSQKNLRKRSGKLSFFDIFNYFIPQFYISLIPSPAKNIHFFFNFYFPFFPLTLSRFLIRLKMIIMVYEVVFATRKWKVDDNSFRMLAGEQETFLPKLWRGKKWKNKTTTGKKKELRKKSIFTNTVRENANDFQIYDFFFLSGHYSWGWKSWK